MANKSNDASADEPYLFLALHEETREFETEARGMEKVLEVYPKSSEDQEVDDDIDEVEAAVRYIASAIRRTKP